MSESKAVESYNAFDSIRNRFGGARKTPSDVPMGIGHQQKKVSAKRRFDPRSTAPPLIPLVEESDVVQEELFTNNSDPSSPVKGRWKHSNSTKANGPDFDGLETASVASGSSAYSSNSSRSELSTVSPSMSELSDISSTDTHFEYDLSSPNWKNKSRPAKIATLKAPFEKSKSVDQSDVGDDEVVQGRTKAWNKYIGDWIFGGVEKVLPPSPVDHTRRISNEVRIPTPTSTPVYGSMENLYGTGSRSSLLSSNPDEESEEEQVWNWSQEKKPPLGKFLNQQHRRHGRRPNSASSLNTRMAKVSCETESSFSETDLTAWACLPMTEKTLSPLLHSSINTKPSVPTKDSKQQEKKQEKPTRRVPVLVRRASEPVLTALIPDKQVPPHNRSVSESVKPVSEDKDEFKMPQKITPARSNKWLEAYKKYRNDKEKVSDVLEIDNNCSTIEEESEVQEETQEVKIGQRITAKSKKWQDAYQKYRTIKETHSEHLPISAGTDESPPQASEESTPLEQRAKVFGGMQRKPLKRSQSFQVGSHSNERNRHY